MKKIFFTVLIFTMAGYVVIAQITLQPNVPAVGLIQKNQLWNVLVINSSNATYFDCRLNLVLRDRLTGQEIFTASTTQFTITAGAKQLNINSLNPVQYNYLSGGANNSLQSLIPVGMYTACYSLSGALTKEVSLSEECIQVDAEPLSPPMLIFPADSAILEIAPTQFTWTPPTPAVMFDRLHYDILITEIQEGQKADEAIQQNIPFYNEGSLFNNLLNYPSSVSAFEKDKWYAWQVVARDYRAYAGKTETWVFKINSSAKETINDRAPYIKLSATLQEVTILQGGILKMEYYSFLSDSTVKIFISRETDKKLLLQTDITVSPGQNFLQYDLNRKINLNTATYYEVKLMNSAGEAFYMKFKPENK